MPDIVVVSARTVVWWKVEGGRGLSLSLEEDLVIVGLRDIWADMLSLVELVVVYALEGITVSRALILGS